ncbi:PREDICTED: hydrocephalus-inducing protein homolog, partial [Acanthisitta chloris]|uniref:hydrocephalus-inducing protein homolog n=1 Tax=Acanthisitta chloris TaxID=57068 RepID=UPI0004F0D331
MKLVKGPEAPLMGSNSFCQLTPSAFQEEMSLTTKQRLARTREMRLPQVVQIPDMIDLDQTLFQPFPSEVGFQNYVPSEVCGMPLVLRNRDKVPHPVKLTLENSAYFKLFGPSGVCLLFPPAPLCYQIENFIVPVQAIGSQAVLDFPDQLDFSVCPVNYNTQKTLLVCNLGNWEAQYHISTQSPFSVIPAVGTLSVGNTMQMTVEFHPLQTGDHSASLVVHYDTGEDIHTSLQGTAVNVHIGLDRNSVTVEKTYLTLSSHGTVVIYNRSNVPAHFQWRAFATQEEEDWQRLRLCQQQKDKVDDFLKECKVDTSHQEHLSLLFCIFQRERAKVQGDPMLSSDDICTIEPVEGEIHPSSSAEITVIFKPQEARVYKQAAQEGLIAPDGVQAIQISFSSTVLGEFKEEFWFSVTGSPKPVTLAI